MANKENKHRLNSEGEYYCTDERDSEGCLPCGLCYNQLPEVFAEDEEGFAYIFKQPGNQLIEAVKELIRDCPVDSIGSDG